MAASAAALTRVRGRLERTFLQAGLSLAGVDEVGRGCLAGPVHAGCAMLDWVKFRRLPSKRRLLIRDSKQLTAKQRGELIPLLSDLCTVWHVASATAEEIDDLGIVAATFLAMRRAIAACNRPIDMLLIDGKWPVPNYDGPQQAVIKGDFLCYSIAAASILAKEVRDSYMHEQAGLFPAYGFESHVGYGTKRHLAMIERYGICPLHRTTFAPIKSYACTNTPTSLR